MHHRRRPARHLFLLTLMTVPAACHDPQPIQSDPAIYRCADDGICFVDSDARSIVGGYRLGRQEVKFEALYRPPTDAQSEGNPWCYRLQDAQGVRFSTTDGPACPAQWHAMQWDASDRPPFPQAADDRLDMVMALKVGLAAATIAPSQHEARWQLLAAINSFEQGVARAEFVDRGPSDHVIALPQDMSDKTKGAAGVAPDRRARNAFALPCPMEQKTGVHRVSHVPWPKAFTWGTSRAERIVREELEFRQEVDLYSKKVAKYVLFGPPTDMDHSAAVIRVYARPRGTTLPWTLFDEHTTTNHGTSPSHKSMVQYQACREFPITQGWFAWKGECPGQYNDDHVCNDDTAYQVWHAWGNWHAVSHCNDTQRLYRVSCEQPW